MRLLLRALIFIGFSRRMKCVSERLVSLMVSSSSIVINVSHLTTAIRYYQTNPFAVFNLAIYPSAGLKFNDDVLDKLSFSGSANPMYSSGTMTMLYHNLDIQTMKKKDSGSANKFLSWSVNSLLRKNMQSVSQPNSVSGKSKTKTGKKKK